MRSLLQFKARGLKQTIAFRQKEEAYCAHTESMLSLRPGDGRPLLGETTHATRGGFIHSIGKW
jgi:hypothetical protein